MRNKVMNSLDSGKGSDMTEQVHEGITSLGDIGMGCTERIS
jgi:hypothetical protein